MKFYLGTHETHWLRETTVPLCISHRRLAKRKKLPRALCSWLLDSGGFSELSLYGEWQTTAKDYAEACVRYDEEIGGLQGAAIQDWMCELQMITKTGLSVREHQRRTINSYFELKSLAPQIPWVPVLQGWEVADYERHVEDYLSAGVNLSDLPLVGIGSVCRRQDTRIVHSLIRHLASTGIKLHAFGFKIDGLRAVSDSLASADSMSWSFTARKHNPLPNHKHKSCANCRPYAELWYRKVNFVLQEPRQRWLIAA